MEETRELIRKNAELVVTQMQPFVDFPFGYTPDSVEFIEGFIERQRADATPELTNKLINTLGSFLGQAVIFCYGGEWRELNGDWAIAFDEDSMVFPFNKVRKQFANGLDDSINSFFTAIPHVFEGKVTNFQE
jgi:hypothetical protein